MNEAAGADGLRDGLFPARVSSAGEAPPLAAIHARSERISHRAPTTILGPASPRQSSDPERHPCRCKDYIRRVAHSSPVIRKTHSQRARQNRSCFGADFASHCCQTPVVPVRGWQGGGGWWWWVTHNRRNWDTASEAGATLSLPIATLRTVCIRPALLSGQLTAPNRPGQTYFTGTRFDSYPASSQDSGIGRLRFFCSSDASR